MANAADPSLDLTLPSTTLKNNQKPTQFSGKPESSTKEEGLTVVHEAKSREKFPLTLTQAVALALKHNTDIRTAYMNRISQRYQYYLDKRNRELWYYMQNNPVINISGQRSITQTSSKNQSSDTTNMTVPNVASAGNNYSIAPALAFTSPIGTTIALSGGMTSSDDKTLNGKISITQPLLKGFGYDINKIAWQQAQITETRNVLGLRTTVSGIILNVIQQYRALISAFLTYQSNQQALLEAKKTLENNQIQVKAGRLAKTELLSSQIQVQSAKNSLLGSENQIKQQQQNFATLLGMKKNVDFQVNDNITIPDISLNEKQLINYALQNKPNYLSSELDIQNSRFSLEQAENNKLWDLSLTASAGTTRVIQNVTKTNDYDVGLNLSIPLDNSVQKKAVLDAKIALDNAKLNLQQQKIQVISQIRSNVSELEQTYKALKVQEEQLRLQEQQVNNTELRLKYGRASAYDLAQQQQQLKDSRNQLIASKIDYLNQLSSLDDYLGTALATWQVVLAQ